MDDQYWLRYELLSAMPVIGRERDDVAAWPDIRSRLMHRLELMGGSDQDSMIDRTGALVFMQ